MWPAWGQQSCLIISLLVADVRLARGLPSTMYSLSVRQINKRILFLPNICLLVCSFTSKCTVFSFGTGHRDVIYKDHRPPKGPSAKSSVRMILAVSNSWLNKNSLNTRRFIFTANKVWMSARPRVGWSNSSVTPSGTPGLPARCSAGLHVSAPGLRTGDILNRRKAFPFHVLSRKLFLRNSPSPQKISPSGPLFGMKGQP